MHPAIQEILQTVSLNKDIFRWSLIIAAKNVMSQYGFHPENNESWLRSYKSYKFFNVGDRQLKGQMTITIRHRSWGSFILQFEYDLIEKSDLYHCKNITGNLYQKV